MYMPRLVRVAVGIIASVYFGNINEIDTASSIHCKVDTARESLGLVRSQHGIASVLVRLSVCDGWRENES